MTLAGERFWPTDGGGLGTADSQKPRLFKQPSAHRERTVRWFRKAGGRMMLGG